MNKFAITAAVLSIGFTTALNAADQPATPDRPGRAGPAAPDQQPTPTPQQPTAGQPQPAPGKANSSIPGTQSRPGRNATYDQGAMAEDEFLTETANELGVAPPAKRPDLEFLKWYGLRPKIEGYGLTIAGNWTIDDSQALSGGLNTRSNIFRDLLDIRFTVDTRAAFDFTGGTFSLDFQNQNGKNGSGVVGDEQGFDNADADGRTQIAELWYQQLFFDNRLRVKVGKVDANTEFAAPVNGAAFINSSFGHPPTITAMPTYPDPATSINVFVYPTPELYAGAGLYDGSLATGTPTGAYGPAKLFRGENNYFMIGEAGTQWLLADRTLPGRLAFGVHYSTSEFEKFDGSTQTGAGGFYAILEQKLIHKNYYDKTNERGVYSFLQYGHADGHVSDVTDYVGGGITWVGPYEKVNSDSLGLGVAAARFTDTTGSPFSRDWETSVEAFYNFQVTPYLSIKPDLQYIFNPGGDRNVTDALVATLRVTLAF